MGAPDEPPASLIGAMLPNPKLADGWLDDQLGPGFALIAQNATCRQWLEQRGFECVAALHSARILA